MDDNCVLENISCFDYLPAIKSKTIDLVLIDPPYEVSRATNFASGKASGKDTDRFRVSMNFGDWDHNFTKLNEVISECYRVLKNGGYMVCFYDLWKISVLKQYFEEAGFNQIRFIEWIKTNPVPLNSKVNYLTNVREIALCAVKGSKPVFHSSYDKGIYEYPICHSKDRFHETQKPLQLFKDIILKHSNEGDTVLDCFSGSGTTAIACLETGRRFIGCEINQKYYDLSLQRIQNHEET